MIDLNQPVAPGFLYPTDSRNERSHHGHRNRSLFPGVIVGTAKGLDRPLRLGYGHIPAVTGPAHSW